MEKETILEQFEDYPVIAAVKDEDGLKKCLESGAEIQIVFVLYGDLCNIGDIVDRLKEGGKTVIVHLDLISGLGNREIVVDYIKKHNKSRWDHIYKINLDKMSKRIGYFFSYALFYVRFHVL